MHRTCQRCKKTNSKLRSGILLFSQTELVLAESKGFPVVTGAEAVNMFSALRSDFVRMSYASYAAELLDQVVAEGQPDGQLFLLILQTFSLLEHIDAWLAVRYLELQLLEQQGYGVELEHCLYCGALLTDERHRGVQGGLLCPACAAAEPSGLWLSREGMTVLRAFNQIRCIDWVWYMSAKTAKIHRALFGFADAAAAEPTVENQRFFTADGFIDGWHC